MTLKEAREVALSRLPVACDGVTYERIIAIGYKYTENGTEIPFIRLQDKNGNSTTDATPSRVMAVEPEEENIEENAEEATV